MSLRILSRNLPRFISRPSPPTAARFLCSSARLSPFQQVPRALSPLSRYAAFSTTGAAREKEGQTDLELSQKLQSELDLEKEMRDSEKFPASIQDYLDSSPFELLDKNGSEEVVLTRKFGDENIRITFSIADLNNLDNDPDPYNDEDSALADEDAVEAELEDPEPRGAQSGGANTKGSINQGVTPGGNIAVAPEDKVSAADRADEESAAAEEEVDEDDDEPSFPARLNVTIEKKGKGTMQIETTAQDGQITIDNVNYFKDVKLADPSTAEAQWKRSGLYEGPPFANLDEDLQILLERYLDERGVNTQLALWVPEYIDFKEQREYLGWLSSVKDFVDA